MSNRLLNSLVLISTLILVTGCVSKGSYDDAIMENELLDKQNQALLEELNLRDEEISTLEAEQLEMGTIMQELLIAGSVKMQLLADGLHIELSHDILFATGSAELSDEGSQLIGQLAQEMTDFNYQVIVMGYTDSVPVGGQLADRFPSNWELAGARAASVVRVMENNGIASAQLGAVSFGSTRPLATNDTPEGRAENRRIEIRLRPVQPPRQ